MATTNLNVKIDCELKDEADAILKDMGLTMTSAINVFVRQLVKERAIPFKIRAGNPKLQEVFDSMRAKAASRGFISDDEIEAEIQAARAEQRGKAVAE